MYDVETRKYALARLDSLLQAGFSFNAASRQIGIPRKTLQDWKNSQDPFNPRISTTCCRCAPRPSAPEPLPAYAYLLGQYLGDGCISRVGRIYTLRISCCDDYPGITDECERAIRAVRP